MFKFKTPLFVMVCNYLVVFAFRKNLTPEESMKEDAMLDPVELMTKYGFQAEKHSVITEDGYILELHRLLPKRNYTTRKYSTFIMHGLLGSSFDWLVVGPEQSLVYILHGEGFDVWLGNARGNMYSRNHVRLNPDNDTDFWKFSWHEIGYFDLPASINYVLNKTNTKQLHYTGHSQGTTSAFVMFSLRPEYNDKIRSFNALAPPVYMSHLKMIGKYAMMFYNQLKNIIKEKNIYEIPSKHQLLKLPTYYLCKENSSLAILCESSMYLIAGTNPDLVNRTQLPLAVSHIPGGCSVYQILHYAQEIFSGRFRQFDHGKSINIMKYNSATPPDYPLEKVTAPTALHWSHNDLLVDQEDVLLLRRKLSNVILYRKVPYDKFNHVDFIYAIKLKELLYDSVIDIIKRRD